MLRWLRSTARTFSKPWCAPQRAAAAQPAAEPHPGPRPRPRILVNAGATPIHELTTTGILAVDPTSTPGTASLPSPYEAPPGGAGRAQAEGSGGGEGAGQREVPKKAAQQKRVGLGGRGEAASPREQERQWMEYLWRLRRVKQVVCSWKPCTLLSCHLGAIDRGRCKGCSRGSLHPGDLGMRVPARQMTWMQSFVGLKLKEVENKSLLSRRSPKDLENK